MLRIAICDDNTAFLYSFKKMVEEEFSLRKVECSIQSYTSGKLMARHHSEKKFDVIFLDIDMPDQSGFEILKSFSDEEKEIILIFVTSHSELVYDSFLFRPLNFISKNGSSFIKTKLHLVTNQMMEVLKQERVIVLNDKTLGRYSVVLRRILYIESNRHNVIYHLDDLKTKITVRDTLQNLENEFKKFDFIKVHRKYLVNLKHIFNVDLTKEVVILKQGIHIPMSRGNKNIVDQALTNYLRRTK